MSISKLKEVLDELDYPVLMEIVDCIWHQEDYVDISYNTDDNKEDLENGDGDTYSVEPLCGYVEYDGYRVFNCDNGCGETITYFFNLNKEVKF